MKTTEANFDGLVGLTHHYAGLSFGNEASMRYQLKSSNPRLAAKQGLLKMKILSDMGFVQGVIPPHERPSIAVLRQLGFSGTDIQVIEKAGKTSPSLLSAVSSASSMWVANAATVSPSADSVDGRVHFTVANLNNKFHRAIESPQTACLLRALFYNSNYFVVHDALPQVIMFSDEGAANHNRLCKEYGEVGVQLFIYGREKGVSGQIPKRYPARQTREASEAVARLHQLSPESVLFTQQNPAVIDQGVFHNDVIAVCNQQVLFCHQEAFVNQSALLAQLHARVPGFVYIEVPSNQVSVSDAVNTYLFNGQLLSKDDGSMILILPEESRQNLSVWQYLNEQVESGGPLRSLHVCDLRESMQNGGGPACLRLRVVLTPEEKRALNPAILMNEHLFALLNHWIDRHYRDRLTLDDLVDPQLLREGRDALDELTKLLNLKNVYAFQQ